MKLETTRSTQSTHIVAGPMRARLTVDADYEMFDVSDAASRTVELLRGQRFVSVDLDIRGGEVDIEALCRAIETELQRQSKP